MKERTYDEKSHYALKRKLMSALALLLLSCLLFTGVTFAWLTLALAPEVSGITTNVGANGALEIALLKAETRTDLSKIQTAVGQSLASGSYTANYTWGNLIDLSHEEFGLGEINLSPARLQISKNGDQYNVASQMLAVPNYGYDGRIINLEYSPLSATYNNEKSQFEYEPGKQDYGVRAIGTSTSVSVQEAALAIAKSNIKSYTESAKTNAKNALGEASNNLFNLILTHYTNASATYNDSDIASIKATLSSLERPLNYIEDSLRYGLVAFAASEIDDEANFNIARTLILNSEFISELLNSESVKDIEFPTQFVTWVNDLEIAQGKIAHAQNMCSELSGGIYTWEQLKDIMQYIMDFEEIYINETKFGNMNASDFTSLIGKSFTMTLASGSGVFADIADFTGDYNALIEPMPDTAVTVTTLTTVKPVYLSVLSDEVSVLEAVGGGAGSSELTSMYGYAIDLAFRTNAPLSDLLLQTDATDRLYDNGSGSTMGGGSYMEFSTKDKNFSFEQVVQLMDAIRVAFVDDTGNVYGIAKLNTSNHTVENGFVKAPLYLYGFSVSEEELTKGALIMDERRKADNTITSLEQNTAKAVTVIVWLDGDIVDNSMVSAEAETSISGILNLQFASSADLVPAGNRDLLTASPNKEDLEVLIEECKETYDAGQGLHTTVSWNDFVNAYNFAQAVAENSKSNEYNVYRASQVLTAAKNELKAVTVEELGNLITEIRDMVGTTEDIATYVLKDEATGKYVNVNPHTMEQADKAAGKIYRVDYDKNLRDEGNGAMTPIYTDASWQNLAAALYEAELVHGWNNTAYEDVDAAITALQAAKDALESRVYFIPYDYEGALYYYAIPGDPAVDEDTYGSWYNSDFKRVVSDLMILKLDAKAVKANIAQIVIDEYISFENQQIITPYVEFFKDIYPDLKEEDILAINWAASNWSGNEENIIIKAITPTQIAYLEDLVARATALNVGAEEVAAAQAILANANSDKYDELLTATEAAASVAISDLAPIVIAAEEEKALADKEAADAAHDPTTAPMTSDQRYVLTAAVSAAKAIPDFDNAEKTELDNLRQAVTETEALLAELAKEEPRIVTEKEADDALTALNSQIVAANGKEVTAYNTILHTIPTGSEIKTVVNTVDTVNANLYAGNVAGQTQFNAVVLTRNGVVIELSKTVTFYAPAEKAEIHDSEGNVIEGSIELTSGATLNAALVQTLDADGKEYAFGEEIKECKWSSSDSAVKVSGTDIDSCKITAEEKSTATINVTVKTIQGNEYTVSIVVTVNP